MPINAKSILYFKGLHLKLLLFLTLSFFSASVFSSQKTLYKLTNNHWSIFLAPSTLAIQAQPAGKMLSVLNKGAGLHETGRILSSGKTSLSWRWKKENITIRAELEGNDLRLTFNTDKPQILHWLNQPVDPSLKGVIWPLGDGAYLSPDNQALSGYLAKYYNPANTTEDLSLPLWTMDYGNYNFSWILLNPWNNQIFFQKNKNQLLNDVSHEFTKLNLNQSFTVLLHLDARNDMLGGAKRYRQWLKDTGRFTSLMDKLEKVPEAKKMPGAPQIYLWDGPLLASDNITDWKGLVLALRKHETRSLETLFSHMDKNSKKMLIDTDPARPYNYQKREIVYGIDSAITSVVPFAATPDDERYIKNTQKIISLRKEKLAEMFKPFTVSEDQWGDGLSLKTINKLHKHGIHRAWLGIPDWRTAMAYPQAIRQAKKLGYAIAVYDSYNTALAPEDNSDWLTAKMGSDVYHRCYIQQENGQILRGYKGRGRYISPDCAAPYFKKRTHDLLSILPLNSWFLDADATGMVYENYNPDYKSSQYDDARQRAKRLEYLAKKEGVIVGSEGVGAVQAAYVIFAQGVDAPAFSWTNRNIFHDRHSKYFVGSYWPTHQPTLFFKTVPLPEQFYDVMFNPRFGIPLFQAVFHDSVITTFHWFNGLFKYRNIARSRELKQMLYAQPPLYHMNAETTNSELDKISHASAFFQRLGRVLATEALTGFKWLNKERTVQETVFGNKVCLIVNFTDEKQKVDNMSVPASSIMVLWPDKSPEIFESHL